MESKINYKLDIINSISKDKYKIYETAQGKQLCIINPNGGLIEISRFLSNSEMYETLYALCNAIERQLLQYN